jgi:hypothetical protein
MIFYEGDERHLALSVWARGGQAPLRAQTFALTWDVPPVGSDALLCAFGVLAPGCELRRACPSCSLGFLIFPARVRGPPSFVADVPGAGGPRSLARSRLGGAVTRGGGRGLDASGVIMRRSRAVRSCRSGSYSRASPWTP